MTSAERNEVRRVAQASLDAHANCRRPTDGPCTCGDCAGWRAILCYVPTGTTDAQHVVDLTVTATGLRAQVESLRECLRGANEGRAAMATDMGVAMGDRDGNAAERDALAAQLAEVRAELDGIRAADSVRDVAEQISADQIAILRADLAKVRAELAAAPKVCAIHSYEHGPGPCMTCGAWPPGTRELIAGCRTRIAGLEQAADERSAEVARLTARVAELEARPVLTHEILSAAIKKARKVPPYIARQAADEYMPHLGPVTLPAQDRAEELVSAWRGICTDSATCDLDPAERMRRALASLGAPPTSPPAARPVFAGVSEDELIRLFYVVGTDGIDHGEQCPPIDSSDRNGIRAVLARLEVSLVAPVDPEEVARDFYIRLSKLTGSLQLSAHTDGDRRDRIETMRTTLLAADIPVTPEVGK